jgi:hypothetical protein
VQNKRVKAGSFFNFKNPRAGPGIKAVGPQAVNGFSGKSNNAAAPRESGGPGKRSFRIQAKKIKRERCFPHDAQV